MRYVLDTNILLHYMRESALSVRIDEQYNPLDSTQHDAIVCVVSVGEIKAIAKINHWGDRKLEKLDQLLDELLITDINSEGLIDRYAEIDAFSHGKLTDRPLGMSARNMGKNDLWIAATASVLNASLLTTDFDFNHLHDEFLDLQLVML